VEDEFLDEWSMQETPAWERVKRVEESGENLAARSALGLVGCPILAKQGWVRALLLIAIRTLPAFEYALLSE
jgi:hypothetical protein